MTFRLKKNESVSTSVRRIAVNQIENAIAEIDDPKSDRHHVVHQLRKRCKKLRGLIRLVRPSLGKNYSVENEAFRDMGRPLSTLRDAKSMVSACDTLLDTQPQHDPPTFLAIRQTLAQNLNHRLDAKINKRLITMRQTLLKARDRVENWELSNSGFEAIRGGLQQTHEQARGQLKKVSAKPTTESLHRLRKHAKYHWYQIRLIRQLWPAVFESYAAKLEDLCELLGDDHDLAMLRSFIVETPDRIGTHSDPQSFLDLLDHKRHQLQQSGLLLGRQLFEEPTKQLIERIHVLWKLWRG